MTWTWFVFLDVKAPYLVFMAALYMTLHDVLSGHAISHLFTLLNGSTAAAMNVFSFKTLTDANFMAADKTTLC